MKSSSASFRIILAVLMVSAIAACGGGDTTGGTISGGEGGTTSSGGAGSGGATGGVGLSGPCAPDTKDCVNCDGAACTAPGEVCCWDGPAACTGAGTCTTPDETACDGDEDCSGGECCVSLTQPVNGQAYGVSTCRPMGACAFGVLTDPLTTTISSVACHAAADCAGVVDNGNVPFSNCCWGEGFDLAACVSDMRAGDFPHCL